MNKTPTKTPPVQRTAKQEEPPVSAGLPLDEAVRLVAAAANPKGGANPGYRLMLLGSEQGQVRLTAGDGTIFAHAWVDASKGPSLAYGCESLCIPAETIDRIFRSGAAVDGWRISPAANCRDDNDPSAVLLSGGRHKFRLPTTAASLFPFPPDANRRGKKLAEIPALFTGEDLKRALRRGAFTAGEAVKGWATDGVLVRWVGGGLDVTSTNGRRACRSTLRPVEGTGPETLAATQIIPVRSARFLIAHLRDEQRYRLDFHDAFLVCAGSDLELTSASIVGRFPGTIDEIFERTKVELEFTTLAGALKHHVDLAVVAVEDGSTLRLTLRPDRLLLSPVSDSETVVELPLVATGPAKQSVCWLDARQLSEALGRLDPHESVDVYFAGPKALFQVEGADWHYMQAAQEPPGLESAKAAAEAAEKGADE